MFSRSDSAQSLGECSNINPRLDIGGLSAQSLSYFVLALTAGQGDTVSPAQNLFEQQVDFALDAGAKAYVGVTVRSVDYGAPALPEGQTTNTAGYR